MAWRLSRYQTFVANTTVIGAAFLNAVQDAITYLFLGSKTVKQLQADGTGDGTPDGTLAAGDIMAKCFRADGDGDDGAAIKSQDLPVGFYKLLWQIRVETASYVRFYKRGNYTLTITVNAVWDVGTSQWNQEDAGEGSFCLVLSTTSCTLGYKASGTATFASFDSVGPEFYAGLMQLYDVRSSATGGAGQSVVPGQAYKDTLPIAWGIFQSDGTITRSANIASCTRTAPNSGTYDVVLQTAPANTNCGVGSINTDVANGGKINVISNNGDVANLRVHIYDAAGSNLDCGFSLVVFGG